MIVSSSSLRGLGRTAMGADGKVYSANCGPGSVWNAYARRCVPNYTGRRGVIAVSYGGYSGVIADNAMSASVRPRDYSAAARAGAQRYGRIIIGPGNRAYHGFRGYGGFGWDSGQQ